MKKIDCPRELEIAQAARSGGWDDSLRAHADGCEICRDVATAAGWMQNLARQEKADGDPSEAGLIWWRAQLAGKRARAERAHEVAAWVEIGFAALLVAGIASWVTAGWQSLQDAAVWLGAEILQLLPAGNSTAGPSAIVFWSILAVVSALVLFVAYPILSEE